MTPNRRDHKSAVAGIALLAVVVAVIGWIVVERLDGLRGSGGSPGTAGSPAGTEGAPLPVTGAPGRAADHRVDERVVFKDTFERPGLSGWQTTQEGRGSVRLVSGEGPEGGRAVRLTVPRGATTSRAFLTHRLDKPAAAVSADGWFKVLSGGCDPTARYSHGNVPFLRFFDGSGKRLVSLLRVNGDCGDNAELWVQHSGDYYRTLGRIVLRRWYHVTLRASTGQSGSNLVEVDLDGRRVYRTRTANNGAQPISSVTTQNDVPGQIGDLEAADVRLATFDPGTQLPSTCPGRGTPPTDDASGKVLVADGFESGGLTSWTQVVRGGDAAVHVTSASAHRGGCGLRIHVSPEVSSLARLSKTLPSGTRRLRTDGWYRIRQQGARLSNVPVIRVFRGSARVLEVHRQNGTGELWARTVNRAGRTVDHRLGSSIGLGEWHQFAIDARSVGARSTFRVALNGTTIYRSGRVYMPRGAFTSAALGAEHDRQKMTLDVDDIVIRTGRSPGPKS